MNFDIILIMCPVSDTSMPPLGLAYISSYIKQQNLLPQIIDMNIELFNKVDENHKKRWEPAWRDHWINDEDLNGILNYFYEDIKYYVEYILSSDVNILGFSVHQKNFKFAFQIAKKIKEKRREIIIIFGGPQCFGIDEGYDLPIFFYKDGRMEPIAN